jgi:hypothetical protein
MLRHLSLGVFINLREGVLRERSEASDARCAGNGFADFSLTQVPGFIVNVSRIFWTPSHDDFASVGFFIRKNGLLQNKKSLPELNHVRHQTFVGKNNP